MVKRTSGRVRKPVTPAGQALVKHRDTKVLNRRRGVAAKSQAEKRKSAAAAVKTEDYEVEGLTAVMRDKKAVWYFVKWVDWPASANTWEPEDHVKETDEWEEQFSAVSQLLHETQDIPDPKLVKKGSSKKRVSSVKPETGKQADGDYEVEQVLGVCWDFENETIEYLIKWSGWPNSSNSWEPEKNVNASDMIKPFASLADYLSRTWSGSAASGPQKSKPGPKSRKAPAAKSTPAKKGATGRKRGRPAAASAATADATDDEDGENEAPVDNEEDGAAAAANGDDVTDEEDGAGDAAANGGSDQDEEEDGPSPAKRGRKPAAAAKKAAAASGKRTPAKRAKAKTPTKASAGAKRKSRR